MAKTNRQKIDNRFLFGDTYSYWYAEKRWQEERLEASDRSPFLSAPEMWNTEEGRICDLVAAISEEAYYFPPKVFKDISDTVREFGYPKKSDLEEDFIVGFFRKWWNGKKRTFIRATKRLKAEARVAEMQRVRKRIPQHLVVTDLSAFVFCPVSYAIRQTFELPQIPQLEIGSELHFQKHLEKYLGDLYSKEKSQGLGTSVLRDMLESKVIFCGHRTELVKPFFSPKGTLAGIPDYIFQRKNGSYFVVEEKHTWRGEEEIVAPWKSDIIQVYGYIFGLQEFNFTNGYIVYFPWWEVLNNQDINDPSFPIRREKYYDSQFEEEDLIEERVEKKTVHPKIFEIEKSELGKNEVINIYQNISQFKKNKGYPFDPNTININKCLGCSARFYCKHKTGLFDIISLPYSD